VSLSVIDRIYYAALSQRNGLQAVTYSSGDNSLEYRLNEDDWVYLYGITLENHGSDTLVFSIKLIPDGHEGFQEVFIRGDNGEIEVFTLQPKQRSSFSGETIEHRPSAFDSGSGRGTFSLVLTSENEQHNPSRIIRK